MTNFSTTTATVHNAASKRKLSDYRLTYERSTHGIPSRMGNELRYPDGHVEKISCGNCKECKCNSEINGGRA